MSEEIVREIEMARLTQGGGQNGCVEVGSGTKRPNAPAGMKLFEFWELAAKNLGLLYKKESARFIVYRPDHPDDTAFMLFYPDGTDGSVSGGSNLERIEENMAWLRLFRSEVKLIQSAPPPGWVAKRKHYKNATTSCKVPRDLDREGCGALRQLLDWMESARVEEGPLLIKGMAVPFESMARRIARADMPDLEDAQASVKYRQGKAGR